MAGRYCVQHLRVADDGRVEADDVFTALHHVPPPRVLDVLLQLHPQRPVVEEPREPVVNLSYRVMGHVMSTKRKMIHVARFSGPTNFSPYVYFFPPLSPS